jgi:inorganic pyrophosphatase
MRDEMGLDDKVLAVPATDPRSAHLQDVHDVDRFFLNEIVHFFTVYKQLEPGKETDLGHWDDRAAAEAIVAQARASYAAPEHPGD